MIRVAICGNHGGFGLSGTAILHLIDKGSELIKYTTFVDYGFDVDDERFNVNPPSFLRDNYYVTWYNEVLDMEKKLVVEVAVPTINKSGDCDQIALRTHPDIIEVIELLGPAANTRYCRLKIVDIPDEDVTLDMLEIGEYDGAEWVRQKHRTWG